MTIEALHVLCPDLKFFPADSELSTNRSVEAFSGVVKILQQEISVTDCKVYNILPHFLGHRHEFIVVVANVDGKEVQVIFQRTEKIKTHVEESRVTVHLGPIQDYFAHHFGMSSLPKYICHLTWKGGDSPKLHHLAETAKNVSNIIKTAGMMGRIEPHQCSLFARSLLGVLATSFPGYVMEPPESVDEPLHHMYGLLYSWFDLGKPNDVALRVVQSVLSELKLPQSHPWEQTQNLLAQF